MTYAEKLKDPRWQLRRLTVIKAADGKCRACSNGLIELQVHHLVYSGEPWEAPDSHLECLCVECHEFRTAYDKKMGRSLTSTKDILRLARFVKDAISRERPEMEISEVITLGKQRKEQFEGEIKRRLEAKNEIIVRLSDRLEKLEKANEVTHV